MDFVVLSLFALLAFISRVVNLLEVPIFTDEAIYIRWAQIGLNDPAHRFISLTDGKQPLMTWAMYPFLKIMEDPLIAGRMVSVLSGVLSAAGLYLLALHLFNRRTAVWTGLIYLFTPFALVYDRLALMDSLLLSLAVWSLYLEVLLVKKRQLDIALLLGMVIGLGLLTKSSAFFFIYLMPFSLLLFNWQRKNNFKSLLKWSGLSLLSILLAHIIYNSLRLSPFFYIIEQKNYSFIYTLSDFLDRPFSVLRPNLNGLTQMLLSYFSWPFISVILIALILALIRKDRRIPYLLLWFIIPFLSLAAFGKVLFPRFLLFMTVPFYLVAADFLSGMTSFARDKAKYLYLVPAVVLAPLVINSYLVSFRPLEARIPDSDRNQLLNDWPSGYGVNQVISFIEKEAAGKEIVLATEGTFGLNPAVYEIYLKQNENITIKGYWPVDSGKEELIGFASEKPTYLVLKDSQKLSDDWPAELIFRIRRGTGDSYLYFFRIKPVPEL